MKDYEVLRRERKRARATQEIFAKAAGISRVQYVNIEKGHYSIQPKHLDGICKVFDRVDREAIQKASLGESPRELSKTPNSPNKGITNANDGLYSSQVKPRVLFFDRLMPESRKDALKLMYDMNQQATQKLDIPWWNGQHNFSFIILDKALDPPYSYGNIMAAMLEEDWTKIKYGDIHVIHAWKKQFVRFVHEHPTDKKAIVLRAPAKKRDEFPDLIMLKEDVSLIGVSLGGAELNLWALNKVA